MTWMECDAQILFPRRGLTHQETRGLCWLIEWASPGAWVGGRGRMEGEIELQDLEFPGMGDRTRNRRFERWRSGFGEE